MSGNDIGITYWHEFRVYEARRRHVSTERDRNNNIQLSDNRIKRSSFIYSIRSYQYVLQH